MYVYVYPDGSVYDYPDDMSEDYFTIDLEWEWSMIVDIVFQNFRTNYEAVGVLIEIHNFRNDHA